MITAPKFRYESFLHSGGWRILDTLTNRVIVIVDRGSKEDMKQNAELIRKALNCYHD